MTISCRGLRFGVFAGTAVAFVLALAAPAVVHAQAEKPKVDAAAKAPAPKAAPEVIVPLLPIRIAVVGPMAAPPGAQAWNGATLAMEEINKDGGIKVGIKPRLVELVKVDTNEIRSVPDATKALEKALAANKIDFIVGGYRDDAVLAMQDVAMARKKIFLGTGAPGVELGARVEKDPARYKYWFRVAPPKSTDLAQSLSTVFQSLASQVRAELKLKTPKVGILGEKTVAVDPLVKAAQENLPKMGLELVGTWRPEASATDLSPELGAIKRSGAQLVLVFVSGPLGTVLGRQWNEQQVAALPFGLNSEAQMDTWWEATAKKGNYMATIMPYGDADQSPSAQAFLKTYRSRFQTMPSYSAAAYDAILLMKETIEQKSTLDSDALAEALADTDQLTAFGRLVFDKRHDPTWGAGYVTGLGVQWQNAALVPIWPNGWHDTKYDGVRPLQLPPGTK